MRCSSAPTNKTEALYSGGSSSFKFCYQQSEIVAARLLQIARIAHQAASRVYPWSDHVSDGLPRGGGSIPTKEPLGAVPEKCPEMVPTFSSVFTVAGSNISMRANEAWNPTKYDELGSDRVWGRVSQYGVVTSPLVRR